MRYARQVQYSWSILRKIWDKLTLHNWHWLVVGLFAVFCILPNPGLVAQAFGVASIGLLLVACLREGRSMDREK